MRRVRLLSPLLIFDPDPPPVKPSLSTIEIPSDNLLNPPDPIRLPLAKLHGRDSLAPGQSFDVTALVHVDASSLLTFRLLLIYRRVGLLKRKALALIYNFAGGWTVLFYEILAKH